MLQVSKINLKKGLKSKLFSFFAFLIILPVFAQIGFSQDSELEKSVYKPKKSNSKKSSSTRPKRTSNKKNTTRKNTSVVKKRPAKKPVRKRSRKVLVTFVTSTPKQEIWSGDKKLGITNEASLLKKRMKSGKYILSVKNDDGKFLVRSKLVDINQKNNKFALIEEKPVEKPKPEPTPAEEELNSELKEAIEATEKVKDIFARYVDPLKTGTVTLADWEFVSKMVKTDKLRDFTKSQIESQSWFSSGQIDFKKGNYKNASVAFLEAIKIIPDSAYPYYALGQAYLGNKQIPEAINSFLKAIQLKPDFALAQRSLGNIYRANRKNKDSISYFKLAIQNGYDTPAVRFDLAKVYISQKRRDEAVIELETVAEKAPTVDVFIALGDLYSNLKREISAYEAYQKATEISPNSATAFYKLGDVLYNAREYERAKKAFEKAIKLDKRGRVINLLLAQKFVREAANKLK